MTTRSIRTPKCQYGRCKHESSTTCRHCNRHVCWRHNVEHIDPKNPWSGCKDCYENLRAQFRAKEE